LLSQLRSTRELSIAEFRAGVPSMRTVRELQQSFTQHFLGWCETFPALLARYPEHLVRKGFQPEEVERELEGVVSDIREGAQSWFSLGCDGELISPEWRWPAWLMEYPTKANSPNARMPLELIAGRRLDAGAGEILRALGHRFEEKLTPASAPSFAARKER